MRRRDLIIMLGGTAFIARAASAQQTNLRRVGILWVGTEPEIVEAFLEEFAKFGWNDKTVRFERRSMGGDPNRAVELSAELASLAPEVIWSESGPALAALLRATSKVPIIFTNVT